MKILMTWKDPDGPADQVREAVAEEVGKVQGLSKEERELVIDERFSRIWEDLCQEWIAHGEYICIEFDTDSGTAQVVKD